eukprot:gene32867-biopygen13906
MHRLQISIGRRRYDIREKLSETFPDLFLHVSIDAMDNKKTNIPQARHFSHTKKTAGGEVLKRSWMDNAAKDNKNAFMFAYLSLLVELGWFEQVYVHFLPPGHTHSNLDQKYSVISQALKNKDVFTLDHLITEVGGVFQSMGDYTKQEVVTSIGDFSAVLKDNVYQMYGHGTSLVNGVNRRLHAFKITRQANRQAGVYFKEYDESGHWRGQWDKDSEPILVLSRFPLNKSVPFKDAPKIRIQELQNIEVHWKSILDVISPKDAAEDIADDLSGPDDLAVREYGLDGQDDIPGPAADDLAGTSAGDGAGYAASITADIRRIWLDSNRWWKEFSDNEKSIGPNYHLVLRRGNSQADKHFVDFPSALSEFPQLDASRISLGENLIAALDDLSIDLPDILQSEVAKGLKDILTMETELARPPTADLLYLHSSQGTKPDTRASYDPQHRFGFGTCSSGQGEALVYTDTDYPEWPSEWMDQKLVPITVKLGRNHKATWTGNIPLDAVQFSCQPTSNMKIPKKYHTSVLLACKAIEDNTRPEAVQSDGDNVDIDGEEEEITAFVDISGISKVVQVNDKTKVNSNLLLTELVGVCNTIISLTNVPECLTDSVDAMKIAYQKFTSCPPTSGGKKKPLQDMLLPIVAAAAAAGAFASAAAAAAAAATDAPSSLSEEGSGSGSGSIGNKRSRRGVPTVPAVHAATPAASTTVFTAAPAATPSSGTATSGFAFSTGSPSSSLAPGRVGTRRGPLKNELLVGTIVGAFTIVGYSPALTCTAVTSHVNPCSRQQVLYSTTTGGPSFTTGKCSHMSCMKQTPSQREAYLATKQVYQKYLRPNAKFIDSRYFKEAERTAEKIRSAGEVVETFIAAPPQYIAAPPQ